MFVDSDSHGGLVCLCCRTVLTTVCQNICQYANTGICHIIYIIIIKNMSLKRINNILLIHS